MRVPAPQISSRSLQSSIARRAFLVAGLALPFAAAARTGHHPPRILFVCQFGTVKSAIARELCRRRAAERGISVRATSRGLTIAADHRSPALIAALAAEGLDPDADPPTPLARKDWRRADVVVTFNPLPAAVRPRDLRDWSDTPSFNDDYAHGRPEVLARIDALLTELA